MDNLKFPTMSIAVLAEEANEITKLFSIFVNHFIEQYQ
jgi:hypothetical protein